MWMRDQLTVRYVTQRDEYVAKISKLRNQIARKTSLLRKAGIPDETSLLSMLELTNIIDSSDAK